MTMAKQAERWSFSAGRHGYQVTVHERTPGGILYARCKDEEKKGGKRWKSLGHRDQARARAYAVEEAAKLQRGVSDITRREPTWGTLFAAYARHRTPNKSATERQADGRRTEMFSRYLGARSKIEAITLCEWEAFQRDRLSGRIDARGLPVAESARRPVRAGAVAADLKWAKYVLGWGTRWRENGHYLLRENPVRGFPIPKEKNTKRPVATQDRFDALRSVSDQLTMEIRWHGKRETQRSYLSELLDICNGTGRRISAVRSLRWEDVRLGESRYGVIRWPGETDKQGRERLAPISPEVRAAIDRRLRERPGIGLAYVFPSPTDPNEPMSRFLARDWLNEAERLAGLEHLKQGGWHTLRRKWATERKHLPAVDVAAAGGWAGPETLQRVYQQTDEAAMLEVVLSPAKLREVR